MRLAKTADGEYPEAEGFARFRQFSNVQKALSSLLEKWLWSLSFRYLPRIFIDEIQGGISNYSIQIIREYSSAQQ